MFGSDPVYFHHFSVGCCGKGLQRSDVVLAFRARAGHPNRNPHLEFL